MWSTYFPEILFAPGYGISIFNENSESKKIFFPKSVFLGKEIATEISKQIVGYKEPLKNNQINEITQKIMKAWIELGGKTKKIIKNNSNKLDFSHLIIKGNHISDSKNNIDWNKIQHLLKEQGYVLEKRFSHPFKKNCIYPIPIYTIKDKNNNIIFL